MRDLRGTTLGHYRILELIGAGGMGVVYRARDPRLDRDVAIKVLPDDVAANPDRVARFEREAKAVAKLEHPNILAIHEFCTDGDVHYAVTELLEGQSLRDLLIAAGGPLPWRRVREIGAAVAEGLGAAHGRGVIHRDLKPENVFITTDGRVKILDFGLAEMNEPVDAEGETATLTPAGTTPGTLLGTVGYMAPEQVRGEHADERSDLFALGCVLYEMLAGKRAFSRETTAEIMTAILREDPPSLAASGADIAPEVERVVERCLEKSPERRFQSARDLAFALESLTESSVSIAPVADDVPQHPRRWLAIAVALVGLSLPLGALLGAMLWSRPTGVDLGSYRFTPFATDPEAETGGVWSPDGRSIVYEKVVDGRPQIFVRGLDADNPVQMTNIADVASGAWWPFWSPDGRRIWFRFDGGISSIGSAGGEPELIPDDTVKAAALSPDGNTLATWRVTIEGERRLGSVWLASPPTAEPRKYEPAPFEVEGYYVPVFLRFSPDGTHILASFAGNDGAQMWLLPLTSGGTIHAEPTQIFTDLTRPRPPDIAWMPDGRRVVMAVPEGPALRSRLWMADVRTQTLRALTAGITAESSPDVAPDGSRIVFTSGQRDYDLVEVPLDGSPVRGVLTSSRREYSAAWVPGQNRFVYITDRIGQTEIRMRSSTGDWDRPLVTHADFPQELTVFLGGLTVSEDGGLLAFHRRPETGETAIWLMPITGGTPTKLAEKAGGQYAPTWSPDGRWLAYLWVHDGNQKLAASRLGATDAPDVLAEGCVATNSCPEWSPTGEWIAYYACDEGQGYVLKLVSPDGHSSRDLASFGWPRGLMWSRDGSKIYTVDVGPEGQRLAVVDAATAEVTTIRDFDPDVVFSGPINPGIRFTLAPDEKSFLATLARDHMDLWLLEGFDQRARWWDRLR